MGLHRCEKARIRGRAISSKHSSECSAAIVLAAAVLRVVWLDVVVFVMNLSDVENDALIKLCHIP